MLPLNLEAERALMRGVEGRIRSWRTHAEYPDILAESYFRAWQSYCLACREGMPNPLGVAIRAAAWGPGRWLRRWYGQRDRNDYRTRFQHVSLDELTARQKSDAHCHPAASLALTDPAPGPEAVVLDRLERAALWQMIRRRATPRQIEVLAQFFVAGRAPREAGRRLGTTAASAGRVRDDALARCRITPSELETSPRPATDYPRCARGHYLTPENVLIYRGHSPRCRLCNCRNVRAARDRKAHGADQEAAGGASGPSPRSPQNGPGIAP